MRFTRCSLQQCRNSANCSWLFISFTL